MTPRETLELIEALTTKESHICREDLEYLFTLAWVAVRLDEEARMSWTGRINGNP